MVKSFFPRYFSFSNKVFYPVAYIMNELQHLTTPTGLKFCLALCFSSGPNSSKFGPSCPQVGSNFFHLAKEMATTFLEPERTLSSFREEDFLRISSCPYIVQEAPIHQSHVFKRIKISRTIFEKGHPRNIPAKLFQNLTSGFGEDFLRISSCPYSARSPHSPEPCL